MILSGSLKNVFENILKTTVSLASISQALGNKSQQTTILESFSGGEHVIAAFLDVEKAFNNVWHNGLTYKIYQLRLPTKLCRWLSDFLVGRVIQVTIEGFLSLKVYPKVSAPEGSNLSPLLFLIYVNKLTCQIQVTTRLTSRNMQMMPASGP